ncbi:MAG: hypothetical protein RLZZ490_51 [Cyanobacteriota bacterium]|jgi:hypothetical protein
MGIKKKINFNHQLLLYSSTPLELGVNEKKYYQHFTHFFKDLLNRWAMDVP